MRKKFLGWSIILIILFIAGYLVFTYLYDQKQNKETKLVGVMRVPNTQWSPYFDDNCASPSPFIELESGEIFYLLNLCTNYASYSEFIDKRVVVSGIIEKREHSVPSRKGPNASTQINIFNVILVSDLHFVENES